MLEPPSENNGEFIGKGRLEGGQPVLRDADQGRCNGLVGAPLRGQSHTRWRRHENEARVLVAGIIESVEAALDEGVIQRADGKQSFA